MNTNKKYDIGYEQNNSIKSILHSASYYNTPEEQFSSVMRSLGDHVFSDGNKRTMFDTFKKLSNKMNLNISLSDTQIWNVVDRVSKGELGGVENIRRAIFGN